MVGEFAYKSQASLPSVHLFMYFPFQIVHKSSGVNLGGSITEQYAPVGPPVLKILWTVWGHELNWWVELVEGG